MQRQMLTQLIKANIAFQAKIAPEELAALAEIFAEDLAEERPEVLAKAFQMHRQKSPKFPRVSDIAALLPAAGDWAQREKLAIEVAKIDPEERRRKDREEAYAENAALLKRLKDRGANPQLSAAISVCLNQSAGK